MCREDYLKEELKKNAELLELNQNHIDDLLNLKYSSIYIGKWKNKGYEYFQLKAYQNSKHITLKHFKSDKLDIAKNILDAYLAYKFLHECLKHLKLLEERKSINEK